MPSITISKKAFEKAVGKKMPVNELKDRISMLGTDLEGIDGDEIRVEVFPNRPDMLSEQGFARAFSSFIGSRRGLAKYTVKHTARKVRCIRPIKEWPYVLAAIVTGISFDDQRIREIIQVQEKLGVTLLRNRKKGGIGIYPLDKIAFPITFTAEEPDLIQFRPLEYPTEITGRQILSKHPAGREYAHICEGWSRFPVFRDAAGKVMSMPPIINSHDVGKITSRTANVFIEATGTELGALRACINIITTTLADMGGEINSLIMTYPGRNFRSPDLKPEKLMLETGYVRKILGLDLNHTQIKKLLEQMGFGVISASKSSITVLVPAYRVDILHQIDLVEDIAIAYGYENFPEQLPNVSTTGEEDPQEIFNRKVAEIVVGLGLLEINTYHLTSESVHNHKMNSGIQGIKLLNAQTQEYDTLRAWLLPGMVQVLSENKHHEYPQNLFNIGTVFKKSTDIEEEQRLGVVLCGNDANFTRIKQVLDSLMNAFECKYFVEQAEHSAFIPGRVAKSDKSAVIHIGELSPEILDNFGLSYPVAALEINLTKLRKLLL